MCCVTEETGLGGISGGPCTAAIPALLQGILDSPEDSTPGGRELKFYLFAISEKESNKWPTTASELSLIRTDNL